LATIWKIRVAFVSLGAVAYVSIIIEGINAHTVAAKACISACLVLRGDITPMISYRPVKDHGYPPIIRVIELGGVYVHGAEVE
jgi:hypothetical protein